MRFNYLRSFNLAMLARQIWRIVQNLESLPARLFKYKYFPKTDYLNGTLGSKHSFVLRSIMASQQLMKESMIWRAGNGKKVEYGRIGGFQNPMHI